MSTTLNFIRPVQLRPGAASVLIGSKTLLQRHQLTASPFSPLLKPVLDGKTAINFVWNEQAEQLVRVRSVEKSDEADQLK